ncbi:MAG: hypothetical protein SGJ18_06680 [Pseudomonadota bacterium]|nr:hypothetical protein [Pseudomonadota bacterium]
MGDREKTLVFEDGRVCEEQVPILFDAFKKEDREREERKQASIEFKKEFRTKRPSQPTAAH